MIMEPIMSQQPEATIGDDQVHHRYLVFNPLSVVVIMFLPMITILGILLYRHRTERQNRVRERWERIEDARKWYSPRHSALPKYSNSRPPPYVQTQDEGNGSVGTSIRTVPGQAWVL